MIKFTHYPVDDRSPTLITQHFGDHPDWYKPYRLPGHDGVDFAAPAGSPVYAVAPGVVSETNNGFRRNGQPHPYGLHVRIDHAPGCQTIYAHLSEIHAAEGAVIAGGEQIGLVGSTGNSTGPHLHLSLKMPGGQAGWPYSLVDPLPYLMDIRKREEQPGETAVSPALQLRVIFKRLGVGNLGDALVRIGELERRKGRPV
jgi:murein DD-endopeptidase MepM/ murein hydrolase activator NlpD